MVRKMSEIPSASMECNELPEDEDSAKIALARKLEADVVYMTGSRSGLDTAFKHFVRRTDLD